MKRILIKLKSKLINLYVKLLITPYLKKQKALDNQKESERLEEIAKQYHNDIKHVQELMYGVEGAKNIVVTEIAENVVEPKVTITCICNNKKLGGVGKLKVDVSRFKALTKYYDNIRTSRFQDANVYGYPKTSPRLFNVSETNLIKNEDMPSHPLLNITIDKNETMESFRAKLLPQYTKTVNIDSDTLEYRIKTRLRENHTNFIKDFTSDCQILDE